MGEIIELPKPEGAVALRRALTRLDDGTRALRQQRDKLARQTESLGEVRAALQAEAARTDEIVALADQVEVALACGDQAALDTLQARLQHILATEYGATDTARRQVDAAD
jgi:hypothetical protein